MATTNTAKQSSSLQTASVRRVLANPCERVPRPPRPSLAAHSCKGMPRRPSKSTHAQIFSGTADPVRYAPRVWSLGPVRSGVLARERGGLRMGAARSGGGSRWVVADRVVSQGLSETHSGTGRQCRPVASRESEGYVRGPVRLRAQAEAQRGSVRVSGSRTAAEPFSGFVNVRSSASPPNVGGVGCCKRDTMHVW